MAENREREVEHLAAAAKTLHETKTGMVLTGRIQNGKLVLDPATEKEIASKFPDADIAFMAVNAPFDPQSHAIA